MRDKTSKMRQELLDEAQYLRKIKRELEAERQKAKDLKARKGREAALVLEENARGEVLKEERRQAELKEDVRLAEYRKQQELAQEARRQAELDARAAKIGSFMGLMEDTVIKKQKELERINDEKLRKHQEDRNRQIEEDERERKRRLQQRLSDVKRGLDQQLAD